MKAANIVKKFEKEFNIKMTVEESARYITYTATIGCEVVKFDTHKDGGNAGETYSIHIRSVNDHSDSMTDYFAGSFWHTIKSAVDCVKNSNERHNQRMGA